MRRIFILFFLLFSCFLPFANSRIQIKSESYFNWITIWLCFFFGLLFTILFRFLNSNSKSIDQRSDAGLPLSGWVVFLGINLIMRVVIQSYFFLNGNYFLKSDWIHLEQLGGARLHTLIIFEMFLSLFSIAGTGALIYWFFGKRDIFPKMFIYFVGFYLLAAVAQIIIYQNMQLPVEMMSIRRMRSVHYFRIIYAVAWVVFIWRSEQVKQTFIYPP